MSQARYISFLVVVLVVLLACKLFGQIPNDGPLVTNPPPTEAPTNSHTPPGIVEAKPVWIEAQIYRDGIRWSAVPGYVYQVFASTAPGGPYTARVSPELPCLGASMGWPVRTEGPAMFYKIKAVRIVRSVRVPPIDPP